jgi:hypothetical protein
MSSFVWVGKLLGVGHARMTFLDYCYMLQRHEQHTEQSIASLAPLHKLQSRSLQADVKTTVAAQLREAGQQSTLLDTNRPY